MFEVKLHNASVHGSATSIYVTNGDHSLVEIAGDDLSQVETVLQAVEDGQSLDAIFAEHEVAFNGNRAYFDQVVDWLVASKVLQRVRPADELPPTKEVPTYFYCPSLAPAQQAQVAEQLAYQGFTFPLVALEDAQLLIVFAPLFESQTEVLRLNQYAYDRGIPLCHIAIEDNTFTIGPLVDSRQQTPCLCCYNQRKLANLRSARKTLSFIRHPNKTRIRHKDISASPYFEVALTHLRIELVNFYKANLKLSPILSRSIVFDALDYSITKSKVLRVPGCSVCNPTAFYRVFNV